MLVLDSSETQLTEIPNESLIITIAGIGIVVVSLLILKFTK